MSELFKMAFMSPLLKQLVTDARGYGGPAGGRRLRRGRGLRGGGLWFVLFYVCLAGKKGSNTVMQRMYI